MTTFTILFNNSSEALYLKLTEPDAFKSWLRDPEQSTFFIHQDGNKTYYISKHNINYIMETKKRA